MTSDPSPRLRTIQEREMDPNTPLDAQDAAIADLSEQLHEARAELARLTQELEVAKEELNSPWSGQWRIGYHNEKKRADQAEQERDEARRELTAEYETARNDPAEQRAERYAMEALDLTKRLMAAEAERETLRGAYENMKVISRKIDAGYVDGVRDDDADNAVQEVLSVVASCLTPSTLPATEET